MIPIFTIIKGLGLANKLKNFVKSKDFIFFILVLIMVIVILSMSVRLLLRRREVVRLYERVEQLEITNAYLQTERLTLSNKLWIEESFTNTTTKIIMITNDFYLEEEDIILRENFKYDFYRE